ncbi:MAG: hypothetical protein NC093_11170 [Alistipes sp.]|nr:hypothetical protein [Alistipes sp.]
MEIKIKIFESEEFGKIRTVIINDEPWFVGKDAASILKYRNGSRDINRHVDEEDRRKIMISDDKQNKDTIIINESGLYSLILSSKMPKAKEFKRWVTSSTLPTIRRTGGYVANTVYTKGFVNNDGCVEIPGVFLEDGAEVELAIKVVSGKFEIAMFPSEEDEDEKNS